MNFWIAIARWAVRRAQRRAATADEQYAWPHLVAAQLELTAARTATWRVTP